MRRSLNKFLSLGLVLVMALGALSTAVAQDEDTLNILYWQAVSTMNPYLSGGTKEIEAASLVLEPLANWDPQGIAVPVLAADIPTLENGGISEDLTQITWNLKEGVVFSDGSPFTAADVVFSWQYCTAEGAGCATDNYDGVVSVEAVDDLTVTVTFDGPRPFPYGPFVGAVAPILNSTQFANCLGTDAVNCTEENFAPIGTGPFVVTEFRPNDVIEFAANENFHVEGQPGFDRVVLKGGGDAQSAARAVLETGEADYAWNLQIEPAILNEMEAAGLGTVVSGFAGSIERIQVNATNPDPALGDMRSVWTEDGSNAHPFLSNPAVRQAMSMAIDRTIIAEQLYGAGGLPACNVVNGPPANASPNNDGCLVQDIEGANALLDEAGILDTDGDGIRELDGVPLEVLYQTSTNSVRQSTQALIKQWWAEIGIETELRNIDGGVFFGGDPASPDTYQKFFADVEMYTSGMSGPDGEQFVSRWLCGEAPTPDNGWLGSNVPRYCNPEYDALYAEYTETGDPERRSELVIAMNDLIIQDYAIIPLVFRGDVSAHANTIEGVVMNGWDTELWNIEEWTRAG